MPKQNENENKTTPKTNGISPVARHNARYYALQAMYQWQIAGTAITDIEQAFVKKQIEKQTDIDYFKELLNQIPLHQPEIDEAMLPFLARGLKEIDPVELAVLRLAIYELLKHPEIPYRVIINEALELAKKFGSIDGYKFVNGVLDRVAKKTRETEVNMGKPQRT